MNRSAMAGSGGDARDPVASRWRPVLDQDGLLRFGGRWTAVTRSQEPVVALLVDHFGELVRTEEIAHAYSDQGAPTGVAIRGLLARIRRRLPDLGLALYAVRGRGVVLDRAARWEGSPC